LAYAFQKDSPYLDLFNYFITQLKESGSYEKISQEYESKPQICPDYSGKSLGFDSCITMFLVILMGLGLGFLLLLMECLLKYFIPDLHWFNSNPSDEPSTTYEVDLLVADHVGWTPLHIAALEGNVAIAEYLVKSGARVHLRDRNNDTPLLCAIKVRPIVELAKDVPNGDINLQELILQAHTSVVFKGRRAG
jgi:hypothetical protein